MTRLGPKRIHEVRCMGGNIKRRALRCDTGNYSWGTEAISRKTRITEVVYNASNNELVRTNTLVKNTIIAIDSAPFKQWYEQYYGVNIGKKRHKEEDPTNQDPEVVKQQQERQKHRRALDTALESQFIKGKVLACISSRPGQVGRVDGYILEGKELEFYIKKINAKKKGGKKD